MCRIIFGAHHQPPPPPPPDELLPELLELDELSDPLLLHPELVDGALMPAATTPTAADQCADAPAPPNEPPPPDHDVDGSLAADDEDDIENDELSLDLADPPLEDTDRAAS